jgi:uncharacterized protein (TIGR00730 family)
MTARGYHEATRGWTPHAATICCMSDKNSICVYCASSDASDAVYRDVARRLGGILTAHGYAVVYGGGATGSMGALADGVVASGGTITGVMPRFMMELEWAHKSLTELRVVEDMRIRKHMMLSESRGLVTLPGGPGTFEELFEALTLKRLGLYTNPIVLVNTRNYFDPLIAMLEHAVAERFMHPRHVAMWQIVAEPEDVPDALANAPEWSAAARSFARVL